ncbi:TonB-dependent receptor [Sphingomonas sp. PB4P5]|uniref:TonB-dependent receptor n=1 Tax=Parasphingomonas puruogangriensis TaxID=3096155 RepID=UPI002FC8583D
MTKAAIAASVSSMMAIAFAAAPAWAQVTNASDTSPERTAQSEDIIVTAQRREQTLIDVPQSVSVITQDTLERQQANTFSDYLKLVPGLQLTQSTPGEGRLIVRGLNTGGVSSTVAVYQDETPFGSSSGLANGAVLAGDFDTFDVARIEVLRGPQGTLYGASSLGGVLKFVTNAPSTEKIEARGRAGIETTRGGEMSYVGNAMINIPLGDTLAFRASGVYRDIGGWIDSIGTGGSRVRKDINGSRVYGGRASLLFKPDDSLSIRLNALIQNIDSDSPSVEESDAVTLKTRYGSPTASIFVQPSRTVAYRVYNGTIDYDFGFAELVSSSSYSTQKQFRREDLTVNLAGTVGFVFQVPAAGATPARFLANELYQAQNTNLEKYTQEVRLGSSGESMFDWTVGGYYTHEKGLIRQEFIAVTPGTLTPITTLPAGTVNLLTGGTPITTLPLLALAQLPSTYEEYAGFANVTLHLGDRFDLDFGGRYSHNNQRVTQSLGGALVGGATNVFSQRSSENVFTYSVAPKIKFGNNASIYARVAKGFRPGGPNAQAPGAPDSTRSYRSDSTINYELGVKAETVDRTFGIELAAFRIDWDDIQLLTTTIDQNGTPFNFNGNGGKARSEGVELTATARPTQGLLFSLIGAITNARLTQDAPAASGFNGDRLPFSPRYSASVNGDYAFEVGNGVEAYVGGSIRSLSKQRGPFDAQYIATVGQRSTIPSYEVVDLRAGVDFGRFTAEVYAKNVGDADGKLSVSALNSYPAGPGGRATVATGMIRPRTIGLSLGARF